MEVEIHRSAIRQIFVGVILLALDINIGIFDILPDVLGYVLIFMAVSQLAKMGISMAQTLQLPTVVLCMVSLLAKWFAQDFLWLIVGVASCVYLFFLIGIVSQIAQKFGAVFAGKRLGDLNNYYVLLCLINLALQAFSLWFVAVGITVAALILLILMLRQVDIICKAIH